MLSDAEAKYVQPYYLKMMSLNAIWDAERPPVREVREVSATVPTDVVIDFLRGLWRPRVMGAWYALRQDADLVAEALVESLATSAGTLTAPPLATVTTLMLGEEALPPLNAYAAAAAADPHLGADGFIAAATERLGGTPVVEATDQDREHFSKMLAVAETIRG